jgi:hypothetical protein
LREDDISGSIPPRIKIRGILETAMKKVRSLFLVLVVLLSLFVSVTGLVAKVNLASRILQILFLPVTAYLLYVLVEHVTKKTPIFDQKSGWRRGIIYYCFILTTALVSVGFFSAGNLPQLISALIFSPMAIYFLIIVLPHRKTAFPIPGIGKAMKVVDLKSLTAPAAKIDIDRRNFLKLIGSAGILAVILGLFSKRPGIPSFLGNVEALEPLTLKNTSGNIIDPAENSPTSGYNISQIDDSTPAYFGFVNKDGAWFIMREGEDDAFRYAKGENNFTTNWESRAKLNYDYFDRVY